ncbi:hypothetical protein [Streptomyces tsukubensis]|uniref:Secreted protein n=1 Tax=Streptomyces tsukubensis TaxID=83656 RepID=A0A1V4AGC3_9ACTN|nr:hypothetical protein [Streptomyces tsukubensis]OON82810.1 hypothetical protein B1H18_01880 [Streptomyces tsukubensis]QFR92014.1 hypothetical protein GBW32_01805 [Streptomyces tsukubensis]
MSRTPLRALACVTTATAAMLAWAAAPAQAAVIWDADAAKGTDVFVTPLCDSPGGIGVGNWNDGHGDFFKFNKPVGASRCEAHSVKTGSGEYTFKDAKTYWFGWDSMTKTEDAQTVF